MISGRTQLADWIVKKHGCATLGEAEYLTDLCHTMNSFPGYGSAELESWLSVHIFTLKAHAYQLRVGGDLSWKRHASRQGLVETLKEFKECVDNLIEYYGSEHVKPSRIPDTTEGLGHAYNNVIIAFGRLAESEERQVVV
jgi:hypothetical protein